MTVLVSSSPAGISWADLTPSPPCRERPTIVGSRVRKGCRERAIKLWRARTQRVAESVHKCHNWRGARTQRSGRNNILPRASITIDGSRVRKGLPRAPTIAKIGRARVGANWWATLIPPFFYRAKTIMPRKILFSTETIYSQKRLIYVFKVRRQIPIPCLGIKGPLRRRLMRELLPVNSRRRSYGHKNRFCFSQKYHFGSHYFGSSQAWKSQRLIVKRYLRHWSPRRAI